MTQTEIEDQEYMEEVMNEYADEQAAIEQELYEYMNFLQDQEMELEAAMNEHYETMATELMKDDHTLTGNNNGSVWSKTT